MTARDEIIALIKSQEQIPKQKIIDWIAQGETRTLGALYVLTDVGWERIQPALTMQEQCSFMLKYLMECLDANPVDTGDDDYLHSGFEAAWEIAAWMKHLQHMAEAAPILKAITADLEALYRRGDYALRRLIITGALEHIFENKRLVELFDYWRDDSELKPAYDAALEWGKAHSDG